MTDETYTPIIKYLWDVCDKPYDERVKAIKRLKKSIKEEVKQSKVCSKNQ